MVRLDFDLARNLLEQLFSEAQRAFESHQPPTVDHSVRRNAETLFNSNTQSYREVLLGCGLARLLDHTIDIRQPYVKNGTKGFSGRTLDEKVVNPFLSANNIPCSKGPYLAVFRRKVKLTKETGAGLKDKVGYDAFLNYLSELEKADEAKVRLLLVYLLYCFLSLREKAQIQLVKMSKLSLEQFGTLIDQLIEVPSGGLLPVLLSTALLRAIKSCYRLRWEIDFQSINVADAATGATGDITVREDNQVILALEVTERCIDQTRVVATFNAKIFRSAIQDYLFVYTDQYPDETTMQAARHYFAQGYEINFLQLRPWVINNLATGGAKCRMAFMEEMVKLLDRNEVPFKLKHAWNEILSSLVNPRRN